ncbi:MAG: Ig-like domain-containing protein [Candidatus Omnitrophota bacterium]|nr:Ig-like domain-containing protein [Candidatus Omnitrophota bacterium]
MRVKNFYLLILLLLSFFCRFSYAQEAYEEKVTIDGKIISGLSQEEALHRYGVPISTSDKLWYYGGPEKLYVYLKNPVGVYLYPRFCNGYVGVPIELKILAGLKEVTNVTSQSQIVLSNPEEFNIVGDGIIVPKKPGDYQVVALYEGKYSNVSFISVAVSNKPPQEDLLISLDIFPYKPYIGLRTPINFYAYGTFVSGGKYSIRDITDNVEWYILRNNKTLKLNDSYVEMPSPVKFRVFCKYRSLQSFPQDVEVIQNPAGLYHYPLRQIAIVPAYLSVLEQVKIPLFAIATYGDNSVSDVTKNVSWQISDKTILKRDSDNIFIGESVGIAKIQATLENLESLPSKIAVSSVASYKDSSQDIAKKEESSDNLFEDIKNDLDNLKNKIAEEENFKYIKIVPSSCDIRAGEEKQLSAFGVRQNNTEEDVTILSKWKSLDDSVATVNSGLVKGASAAQTKVCVQYKDMENECASVVVREPKLLSITVSPEHLKIITGEQSSLKAEGLFGDSSRKDITLLVNWVSDNLSIAKVDKFKVKAFKAGQTKIHASYLGVESVAIVVEVVKEKYWLLKLIAKILASLLLLVFILYSYFYILTEQVKWHILKLYSTPREFIIALYGNLNKGMVISGAQYKFYMPPLLFATLIDEKYAINGNLFFKFTQRFEEAKYSSHIFAQDESRIALENYNQILKIVSTRHKKITIICNHLKSLLNKTPFFIEKIDSAA